LKLPSLHPLAIRDGGRDSGSEVTDAVYITRQAALIMLSQIGNVLSICASLCVFR
jgi:hypothetical protein